MAPTVKPSVKRRTSLRLSVADLVVVWLLIDVNSTAAYIDPGTGSALFYVITGLVVAIYFSIRGLYYRALDLILRVRRSDHVCEVAIHCEAPRYEATLLRLAESLARAGIASTFFTMYERDDL